MPITITATANSASANSFVTEAEFIAYLATRLNVPTGSTVSGSTCSENEKKAMIEATRELNDVSYIGVRHTSTQALAWGRDYAENPDAESLQAIGDLSLLYFASDTIPQRIKDATCELAMQFLKGGTTDIAAADPNAGVTRKVTDVLETDWDVGQKPQGLARFPRVLNRLEGLLKTSDGPIEVVRV